MSGGPGFAVAVPARDGLPDVLEAVESALAQSLPPAEVVVVDDESSDGTAAAVRERFGGRVRIVSGRFGSAAAARNAAWRASVAPWVAFLDADDLWSRDKLETAAGCLAGAAEAAWFFSDGAFRSLGGEWHDSWLELYAELPEAYVGQPVAELIEVNFILTSSVLVRRDALVATGGFDETMSHAEDIDLWIRLARRWPAAASRRSLVRYQHRPGGLTRQLEARLEGDVSLFRRLAADRALPPRLRRRARHREAMAHYKLGYAALREDRGRDARAHLARAWMFPERAVPVVAAWTASLLPPRALARLRRGERAKRWMAAPMLRGRRIVLTPGTGRSPGGTA